MTANPSDTTGPLAGLTVLELSRVAPGAFCSMMLADLGAVVIKVESLPGRSGTGSAVSPTREQARSVPGNSLNRNKLSLSVDLKSERGRELAVRLVETADVLIDGFRPGVLDKLGLGFAAMSEVNPRLVYSAMTGFGSDGPYASAPGHDLTYLGMSGVLAALADEPGATPVPPLNLIADLAGAAMHATVGTLAALAGRHRTGRGQFVDISYLDTSLAIFSATSVLREHLATGRTSGADTGFLRGRYPYYRTYHTGDDQLLSLGCLERGSWERLCRHLGREHLVEVGPRAEDRFRPPTSAHHSAVRELSEVFRTKDRDQWFDELIEQDIAVGKVYELSEVWSDPQVRHRRSVLGWPPADPARPAQIAPAIRLSDTPATIRTAPPVLGQHSAEILRALGCGAEEVVTLHRAGTIHCGGNGDG